MNRHVTSKWTRRAFGRAVGLKRNLTKRIKWTEMFPENFLRILQNGSRVEFVSTYDENIRLTF